MITDKDIKKMKEVFATKEDLKVLESKMATKDELKVLDTNLNKSTNELVELITTGFNRMDKAIERLGEHDEMIENHEHRLDKLEDKIFA